MCLCLLKCVKLKQCFSLCKYVKFCNKSSAGQNSFAFHVWPNGKIGVKKHSFLFSTTVTDGASAVKQRHIPNRKKKFIKSSKICCLFFIAVMRFSNKKKKKELIRFGYLSIVDLSEDYSLSCKCNAFKFAEIRDRRFYILAERKACWVRKEASTLKLDSLYSQWI